MKININTDDLVSRVSVHIAAWAGAFFSCILVHLIKVMLGIANRYDGSGNVIIALLLAISLFIPLFVVFCIESVFKLKIKFKFLKNKFIKCTTLIFFTIYLIFTIGTFVLILFPF